MTTYTVVNGTEAQITPTAGVTVDALTYKDAITLTAAEVATLLTTVGVAVMATSPSKALKRVIFGKGAGRPTCAYRDVVNSDGPLAYYRLAEASGASMLDASGHARTAELWGAVARYTRAVTGLIVNDTDKSIKFDAGTRAGATGGTDDAGIDCPTGFFVNLGPNGEHTIEAWVEIDHLPWTGVAVIAGWDTASAGLSVAGGGGANDAEADAAWASFMFNMNIVDANSVQATVGGQGFASTPIGSRFHVVSTFDGTTVAMYVNGVLKQSDTFFNLSGFAYAGSLRDFETNGGFKFAIGNLDQVADAGLDAGFAGYNQWAGTIDEVAIYAKALSETRVLAHYNAGK